MPDEKTIRRRRAVFLLLLVTTLILLTGSLVGAFGGAERGFAGIVSPIQDGVSKAVKPARDLANWVGDTFRAKSEIAEVREERDELRQDNARLLGWIRTQTQRADLDELSASLGLERYEPVEVSVIGQPISQWYRHVTISKGSSDGIAVNDPVVGPDGVVGVVSRVLGGSAVVRLLTDPRSGIKARVNSANLTGVLEPAKVGSVGDLVLNVSKTRRIDAGDLVVTAGSTSAELPSLFPADLPVGQVSSVTDADTDSQVVNVRALADLRRLETLRVLTAVEEGT